MTEIKICGITRLGDALFAAACGVDALGFIFYPPSPRYIPPAAAQAIIKELPKNVARVGVFVNEAAALVERTAAICGLDLIQLHGDESATYCRLFPSSRLIKAVSPDPEDDLRGLGQYDVRAFLLDARDAGRYGGTGKRADWGLAARVREGHPLILAGGLHAGNVAEAMATVRPQAVDINSGAETEPGKKDHGKVKGIIDIIRQTGETGGASAGIFKVRP